jgi:epoxyqueuosine reductase
MHWGATYHDVIKGKLKHLAQWLAKETGQEVKVFVDTAPLMEKPLAKRRASAGRASTPISSSRSQGSWFFLGAILSTAELERDAGRKRPLRLVPGCLDICPTNAFPRPINSMRGAAIFLSHDRAQCHIAREFRRSIGNRIYGCDDCLAVCP